MIDVDTLAGVDRAHRRLYSDPAIFEMEQQRIFSRTWLYVAHESELKHAGDFVAARMARLPVLVTRDSEGAINVLVNRCGHRGQGNRVKEYVTNR